MPLRKSGIAFRLNIAMAMLVACGGLTAGIGLETIYRQTRTLEELGQGAMPRLLLANQLDRQAQRISAQTTKLLSLEGERASDVELTRTLEILGHLDLVIDQLRRDPVIGDTDAANTGHAGYMVALQAVDRARDTLAEGIHRLRGQLNQLQLLRTKLRKKLEDMRRRRNDPQFQQLSATNTGIPMEFWRDAGELTFRLVAAESWLTLADVTAGERDVQALLDKLKGLSNGDMIAGFILETLNMMANGPEGVIALRRQQLVARDTMISTMTGLQVQSELLVAIASEMIGRLRLEIDAETQDASKTAEQTALHLTLAILVSTLAGLATALYVVRRVSRRLARLETAVTDAAAGKTATPPTDGFDEIANLGKAFEFFLGEIRQREARLAEQAERLKATLSQLSIERGRAEAASQAKSEFLSRMSHELRSPLTAIIGFSEIMHEQAFGPLGQQRYVEYAGDILASARLLLSLINDILDLAKIEAGRLEIDDETVDLGVQIEAALRMMRTQAKSRNLTLTSGTATLPTIRGDGRAIRQILNNLLSNSMKFTPEGGVISILGGTNPEGSVWLAVRDTGIGIPADALERVMHPFAQVEGREHVNAHGTGLGLAIVKALTELHGGNVMLESILGVGTTVTITLPPGRVMTV